MNKDCQVSPKEEYEIVREVSQLRRDIEKMVGLTGTLLDKLSPVLRSDLPGPDSAEKLSQNTCTPLGAELRTLIQTVSNTSATQSDILDRLEL